MIKKTITFIIVSLLTVETLLSQQKENEFVLASVTGQTEDDNHVRNLLHLMKDQNDAGIFNHLMGIFSSGFQNQSTDVANLLSTYLLNSADYVYKKADGTYDIRKDAAIVVLYRNMSLNKNALIAKQTPAISYVPAAAAVPEQRDANGIISVAGKPAVKGVDAVAAQPAQRGEGLAIDFTSLNSIVYHRDYTGNWSNYLLATKKIIVILVDAGRNFYNMNEDKQENQLSNSHVLIRYRQSLLTKSFKGMKDILTSSVGVMAGTDASPMELKFTFFVMDPRRIKDPCDVVVQNKTFSKDQEFTIHEKNFATFQVGVVNDKYRINNFSISGGNLVVTPDDTQKEQWKSNMNALFEVHLPRDVDNFRPIWKVLFQKNPNKHARNIQTWLYNMTLSRVGLYGGLKISKDPLSNLHAGFNYAITKELYVNLGWTWSNEVVPQVTQIGDISSISDALKYAKRTYSKGNFSWGLSFAPTAIIDMLGIGKENEK